MDATVSLQSTVRRSDRLGFFYLLLVAAIMLGIATSRPHRHYFIFTHASQDLFQEQNPYGKAYDNLGVMSFWLYSPTAAFIYKPLSLLPPRVGNFVYLLGSIAFFYFGLFRFLAAVGVGRMAGLGLFYFVMSNELIGAINNSKLELATMGGLFWVGSLILRNRNLFWAGILLGVITNWKFQPLPTAFLLGFALLLEKRVRALIAFATGFVSGLVTAYALPFAFFPKAFLTRAYRSWQEALDLALTTTWQIYQSLYTSAYKLFNWPNTITQVTILGAIAGLIFAGLVAAGYFYRRKIHETTDSRPAILTALALGGAYSVLFSPMSQSSAYVLATPLLLLAFIIRNRGESWVPPTVWTIGIWLHWIFTSYFYSDLALPAWRGWAGQANLKPVGFTVLLLLLIAELLMRPIRAPFHLAETAASS